MKRSNTKIIFVLFIAGQTPHSIIALSNLKKFCSQYLSNRYTIKIIDLVRRPELAKKYQITAIPTIFVNRMRATHRIIGDLSDLNLDNLIKLFGVAERKKLK